MKCSAARGVWRRREAAGEGRAACEAGAGNVKSCRVAAQTNSHCCFVSLIKKLAASQFETVCSFGITHDFLINFLIHFCTLLRRHRVKGRGSRAQGDTTTRHVTLQPAAHRERQPTGDGVCRGCRPAATRPLARVWGPWRVRAACACATCCMRARTPATNCRVTPAEGISRPAANNRHVEETASN